MSILCRCWVMLVLLFTFSVSKTFKRIWQFCLMFSLKNRFNFRKRFFTENFSQFRYKLHLQENSQQTVSLSSIDYIKSIYWIIISTMLCRRGKFTNILIKNDKQNRNIINYILIAIRNFDLSRVWIYLSWWYG